MRHIPLLRLLPFVLFVLAACNGTDATDTRTRVGTFALPITADATVTSTPADKNIGDEPQLEVRKQGQRRALVAATTAEILAAVDGNVVVSAQLELTIDKAQGAIPSGGKSLSLHALNQGWTELGVTWNCPDDADESGGNGDCASPWDFGGPGVWDAQALSTAAVVKHQTGTIAFDITAYVQAIASGAIDSHGLLIKGTDEEVPGHISFGSRESGDGPRLILETEGPPPPPTTTTSGGGAGTTVGSDGGQGGTAEGDDGPPTTGDAGDDAGDGEPPSPAGTVQGQLVTSDGMDPIAGAIVQIGSQTAITDNNGTFVLAGVPVGDDQTITAIAEGYSTASRNVDVVDALTVIVQLCAAASEIVDIPDIEVGGELTTTDNVTVVVPQAAFVDAAGAPVVGNIVLQTTLLNTPAAMMAAPGDMLADDAGTERSLESFGMVEFRFTQDGEELQLAPEVLVEIRIPLSAGHGWLPGDEVGLWNYDEAQGIWVLEDYGTVDGDEFVAMVDHFSWWNADQPITSTGCVTGTLVDGDLDPVSGASLTLTGVDYNGQSSDSTAADGSFCVDGLTGGTGQVHAFAFDPGLGIILEWSSSPVLLGTGVECSAGGCIDLGTMVADFTAFTCVGVTVPDYVDLNPTPNVQDVIATWRFEQGGAPIESGDVIGETLFGDPSFCLSQEIGNADTIVVDDTGCPGGPWAFPLTANPAACGSDDCQVLDVTPAFDCYDLGGGTTSGGGDGGPGDGGTGGGPPGVCTPPDADGDGLSECQGDCNDADPNTYPSAVELCSDGIDTNCNGYGDTNPPEGGCVAAADGESCDSFIDLGLGGAHSGSLSTAIDEGPGCYGGPSHVVRFVVPEGPSRHVTISNAYDDGVGFTLAQQECEPGFVIDCFDGNYDNFLAPGQYFLQAQWFDGSTTGDYSVVISQQDPDTGDCLPADDVDMDGYSLCDGDCDDSQATISPGASDTCNGIDDNCDGAVDNPSDPCSTGLPGACDEGYLVCIAGAPACYQAHPAIGEICTDLVDNDCDGLVDEDGDPDPGQSCATLQVGASCSNPIDLDLQNLAASGSFAGAFDSVQDGCFGGQFDIVTRFTVPDNGGGTGGSSGGPGGNATQVRFSIPNLGAGNNDMDVGYSLYEDDCDDAGQPLQCVFGGGGEQLDIWLAAGTYYVVASSWNPTHTWALQIALVDPPTCVPDDVDGDGVTVCDGDCWDLSDAMSPDLTEDCSDGIDNDCDGQIDEVFGACATGLPGVCDNGFLQCQAGPAPVCSPIIGVGAQDEICGNLMDDDCDTVVDEAGCTVVPPGESCDFPIDLGLGGSASGNFAGATNDEQEECWPDQGADIVFSFEVPVTGGGGSDSGGAPSGGAIARLDLNGSVNVGFALYGETCGEPSGAWNCLDGNQPEPYEQYLEPGTYYVIANDLGGGQYSLQLSLLDPATLECLGGDLDGDGFDVCQGDCDDDDDQRYPGATEVCDLVPADNDCNGIVDDLGGTCVVGGQVGVCANGFNGCDGGSPSCIQVNFGGVEICGDGVDNDCDGEGEGTEDPDCIATGVGDTCEDPIDLGFGGNHSNTLAAASDTYQGGCGGGVDHFIRFEVPGGGAWQTQLLFGGAPSTTFAILGGGDCGMLNEQECFGAGNNMPPWLPPGEYYVLVSSTETDPGQLGYSVSISSFDPMTGVCTIGDSDADGFSICNGDCNDGNGAVFPGQTEDCSNGIDDNCDGAIDSFFGAQCSTGDPGNCDAGHMECVLGAAQCVANNVPGAETCGDMIDSDCDGVDETDSGSEDCTDAAPGEHCGNAIDAIAIDGAIVGDVAGASDDLNTGCFGGPGGGEHVYRFDIPGDGDAYQARLTAPGGWNGCFEPMHLRPIDGCNGGGMGCMGMPGGLGWWQPVEAGTHHIVIENFDWCGGQETAYDFQLMIRNVTQGTCDLPAINDADSDGATLCDDDCDDNDAERYPGRQESCDGEDNDCDGQIDELDLSCVTALPGVCAGGGLHCFGTGISLCVQSTLAREEICFDDLDNDCDADPADDDDTANCVEYPPGSCEAPLALTVGLPVVGDLTGAADNVEAWCMGAPEGGDTVLRFEVPGGGGDYEVTFDLTGSDPQIGAMLLESCDVTGPGPLQCIFPGPMGGQGYPLAPGTYHLVVESEDVMSSPNWTVELSMTPLP